MTMYPEWAATHALEALPIGSRVAAAYVDDDDTATVILYEHRIHEGERRWWDLTRRHVWWTAREIVQAHDDMVVAYKPTTDEADALHRAIGSVLCNASNYPSPAGAHILGRDMAPLIDMVKDAVLAAGFERQEKS